MRSVAAPTALVVVAVLLSAVPAAGSPRSLEQRLQEGAQPPGLSISLLFEPVCGGTAGRVAYDEDRMLPPASLQKIVTSAAALDLLGPDHQFTTRLLADGEIREGRLSGNLYLVGDGDPFLVSERLWLLAQEAAATGLRSVDGEFFVDAEVVPDLDSIRVAEGTDSPYAAPVSRLGVNFNNLTFLIRPSDLAGTAAWISQEPFPIPGVVIDNLVTTVRADGPNEIRSERRIEGDREAWVFEGTVPLRAGPVRVYRSCREPSGLAGTITTGLLAQFGISVASFRQGKPPDETIEIARLPSRSLGSLVQSMNRWSNNFMADLLLVDLGGGSSARSGAERILGWLGGTVRLSPLPVVHDGSGLSSLNKVSARSLVRILVWAHGQERVFPDLFASFPRPAGEGTLKRRFTDPPIPSLRAKTGTLGDHGVSGIAGYVDRPGGERYAFCILQQASPEAHLSVSDLRAREEGWIREFVGP